METDKMIERMKRFVVVGEMQRFEDDSAVQCSGSRIAAVTEGGEEGRGNIRRMVRLSISHSHPAQSFHESF